MSGSICSDLWVRGGVELMAIKQVAKPFPLHFHDSFVVEIVLAGVDCCEFGGETFYAEKGDIFIINPFQAHSGGLDDPTPLVYLSANPTQEHMDSICKAADLRRPVFKQNLIRDPAMTKIFLETHEEAIYGSNPHAFDAALGELIERYAERNPDAQHEMSMEFAARTMLERCREGRSLNEWASEFGYSPFHFLRLFTRYTGMTPIRYTTAARVDWARKQLKAGHTAGQVATEAGFFDQAHFTRTFHAVVGMTPAQYARKSNLMQDPTS
jgi:AraC-like DNA-binding protein